MKLIAKNQDGISVRYTLGGVKLVAFVLGSCAAEYVNDDLAQCIIDASDGKVEEYEEKKPSKPATSNNEGSE